MARSLRLTSRMERELARLYRLELAAGIEPRSCGYGQWMAMGGLTSRGLVTHVGSDGRKALYTLTDAGRTYARAIRSGTPILSPSQRKRGPKTRRPQQRRASA